MSAPTPAPPPEPSFTFGGYAPQPGQLEGVGFWPRVGARIIDLLVHYFATLISGFGFGLMIGVAALLTHTSAQGAIARIRSGNFLTMIAALVGSSVYHIVLEGGHGSTLGKRVLGLVVVQEDGSPCRWGSALKRTLAYYLDAIAFGLVGYLEMKRTISEQRHGDKWAKTVVCKRSSIPPDKLRDTGRFLLMLGLGVMADAFAILTALTILVIV